MKKIELKHFKSLIAQTRKNKIKFAVYMVLRLIILLVMINSIIKGAYENVFVCILALVLFMIPAFIETNFGISLPTLLEIIIFLFIFAAEILGEIDCYYVKFAHFDTILHTINGFICAAVGFSLVDIFNRNPRIKFKLSPIFLAIVAFCFSMTIGVMWEFFEFGCDMFFHTDMQKDYIINSISSVTLDETHSNTPVIIDNINEVIVNGEKLKLGGYLDIGLIDTMKDLFVNLIGALVFSIIGYFYISSRGKNKLAKVASLAS